jgi:hypothetical protein
MYRKVFGRKWPWYCGGTILSSDYRHPKIRTRKTSAGVSGVLAKV